jgi:hypothetical protein
MAAVRATNSPLQNTGSLLQPHTAAQRLAVEISLE